MAHTLRLDPEHVAALNSYGYYLADLGQTRADHEEGLALIQRAATLRPWDDRIRDSLGWALHRLGRDEEALEELLKIRPPGPSAEYAVHLLTVRARLGQTEAARTDHAWAVTAWPGSRSALDAALASPPN